MPAKVAEREPRSRELSPAKRLGAFGPIACKEVGRADVPEFSGPFGPEPVEWIKRVPGMARPREFDEAEATRRAVEVFWSKGYEGTSLSDLMAATGLSKSSLYQAFGDKRQLFLAAFEFYRDERFRQMNEHLNDGQPARRSLEGFFRAVVAERPSLGCMTCNIGVELAPHDAEIRRLFEREMAVVQQAFLGTIQAGTGRRVHLETTRPAPAGPVPGRVSARTPGHGSGGRRPGSTG